MDAIENEKLITESDGRQIMLTTHRIRYHETASANSNFISIMLDKISSIELTFHSNIWLLIIGIITAPILIGIILIVIFFKTRQHIIKITPDGGQSITFQTRGMSRDKVEEFISKVENASMKLKQK